MLFPYMTNSMESFALKFPFKWEERFPLIYDKIFFVPAFYQHHDKWSFPAWQDEKIFGREAPVRIEYCSGNGEWIIQKAKMHPECNSVAVEKKFHRVKKIWAKRKNQSIDNLFIVCGEASAFTEHYVPNASVEKFYINFPDPWPKARHAKHRLIQENFLSHIARACQQGTRLTIATDHSEYVERIALVVSHHPLWTSVFPAPYFTTQWDGYGDSFFDRLWRKLGRSVHDMQI